MTATAAKPQTFILSAQADSATVCILCRWFVAGAYARQTTVPRAWQTTQRGILPGQQYARRDDKSSQLPRKCAQPQLHELRKHVMIRPNAKSKALEPLSHMALGCRKQFGRLRPGSIIAAGLYPTSTKSHVHSPTLPRLLGSMHNPSPSGFHGSSLKCSQG